MEDVIKQVKTLIEESEIPDTKDGDTYQGDILIKVGDWTQEPRVYSEPEDAVWRRELSEVYYQGVEAGIRATYLYMNSQVKQSKAE
jgi:hypothetical protein